MLYLLSYLAWNLRRITVTVTQTRKRALLRPFAGDPPPATLSPGVEASLRAEYQGEVALVRELSGLPLPSLEGPP